MKTKLCSSCERRQPVSNFYWMRADSIYANPCKSCWSERHKKWRLAHLKECREYRRAYDETHRERIRPITAARARAAYKAIPYKDPSKYRDQRAWDAHWKVSEALRSGRLVRPKRCELCGSNGSRVEAHHPNYAAPLAVDWLCPPCHRRIH